MRPRPEPRSLLHHLLQDTGTLAVLALLLVPCYFLLNQYWRSLVLLGVLYLVLSLLFLRLGWYMRHVMRRQPAEIPPWYPLLATATARPHNYVALGSSEALTHATKDPLYLQEVLKPRLRHLVAYRLSGSPALSFEDLDATRLAQVEPALLDFLTRRENTGLWATYRYRRQRLRAVLAALRYVEAV